MFIDRHLFLSSIAFPITFKLLVLICHRYIVFRVSSKEVKYQLEAGLFILYPKHYINNKKAEIVSVGGRILFMCIVKIYQGKSLYTSLKLER